MRVSRISVVFNWLNLYLSLAGLSRPLYIGGQVSRNRSFLYKLQRPYTISSRISTMSMLGPSLTSLRGTQIMGSISYTLVTYCPGSRCMPQDGMGKMVRKRKPLETGGNAGCVVCLWREERPLLYRHRGMRTGSDGTQTKVQKRKRTDSYSFSTQENKQTRIYFLLKQKNLAPV
jgi:hypothetical protein